MTRPRRRQAGEGGVSEYTCKTAPYTRYLINYDNGTKRILKRGFATRKDAATELRRILQEIDRGVYVEPSKEATGAYLDRWLAGMRLKPSTCASYAKNIRIHIKPNIGDVPLSKLTPATLAGLYRQLEASGRVTEYKRGDQMVPTGSPAAGLSPRTVRYVHQILHRALSDAVEAGQLAFNPAARKAANPPSAKQSKAPEMHTWTGEQLAAFLRWSAANSPHHAAFYVLSMTGMRRGEFLALRWRDVDVEERRISVRRSVGVIKTKDEPQRLVEGGTKTDKPRVIDADEATLAVLRSWRRERGALALQLARDDALVFGDLEGQFRNPESFSRSFRDELARCRTALGETAPPVIRVHDLRHTHATLLLMAGEPVKVVSERLGHATAMITLTTYAHVHPGMQRAAADRLSASIFGGA